MRFKNLRDANLRRALHPLTQMLTLLLLLLFGATAARAQDATAGKASYNQHCIGCHGNPLNNQNGVLNAAGNPALINNAIAGNKGGMGALKGLVSAVDMGNIAAYLANPNGDLPQAAVSTGSVDFGAVTAGTTATNDVTLSSASAASLSVQSIKIVGGAASPFSFTGVGACAGSGTLAGGASCKISVSFKPSGSTSVTDALTISSNSQGGAVTVNLSGGSSAGTPPPGGTTPPSPAPAPSGSGGKSGGGCSLAGNSGQRDLSLLLLLAAAATVAAVRRATRARASRR